MADSSLKKPSFKFNNKSMLMVGVLAVSAIAIFAVISRSGSDEQDSPMSSFGAKVPKVEGRPGGEFEQASESYRQAVLNTNEEKANEAEATGGSVLPRPVPKVVDDKAAPAVAAESTSRSDAYFNALIRSNNTVKEEAPEADVLRQGPDMYPATQPLGGRGTVGGGRTQNAAYSEQMAQSQQFELQRAAMQELLKTWDGRSSRSASSMVTFDQAKDVSNVSLNAVAADPSIVAANANSDAAQAIAQQADQPVRYFSLGDMLFGRLSFTASNKGSPAVLAEIISGPYQGARLLGSLQASDEGLIILFNRMSIPSKGVSFTISGLAIDMETARSTVFTKHKSYFWTRLFYSLGLGMIQGTADAIAAVGETVVDSGLGGSTVARDEPSVEDAVAAGVAQAAQTLGQQVQSKMSQLTDLYEFDANTPLAIVMLQDVDVRPSELVAVQNVDNGPVSTKRFTQ